MTSDRYSSVREFIGGVETGEVERYRVDCLGADHATETAHVAAGKRR
jgi:hypothetical protein